MLLYAPGALFDRLSVRPHWGATLLLGAALVAASFLLIPTELWERTVREQVLSAGQDLPDSFAFGGVARIAGLVVGVVFWVVLNFLLAGFLALVFAFLLGDEARYRQYLSVVSHAFLIPALGSLVLVPLRLAQGDPQLTLNVGLFAVGLDQDGYPHRFLRMLDLFMLWSFMVTAVGVSHLDRRRGWGSPAAVLLVFAFGLAALLAIVTPA